MPRLRLATRIVVVQHNRERHKPTNTGRLVHLMLENSALVRHAVRDEPFDPTPLSDPRLDYHLLFPRDDAREIDRDELAPDSGRQVALVVLDGTWAQCSRMSRRVPVVNALPCLMLPAGPPTHWGVRTTPDPGRVSTLDAVIRVLGLLEGRRIARELANFFDLVAARTLFMKGKLSSPMVPDVWREKARQMWGE